jgi:hypothetical protein
MAVTLFLMQGRLQLLQIGSLLRLGEKENVLFLHKKTSASRALSPLLILGDGVEREEHVMYISLKLFFDEVISRWTMQLWLLFF